ncbi:MAG: hypothetical protein P1P77_04830 [Spirochaetaceae bacterium]|nr:hypothetical protein [Spirochaetaceae bacterium]
MPQSSAAPIPRRRQPAGESWPIFHVLASLIVISAVRLFRPRSVSSARRGVLLVKSLPLVPLVLTPLSVILPGAWPAALGPLALLGLLVMVLTIFMRQPDR